MFLLQSTSPTESGLNLLGVYLIISLAFVFLALVELAFILIAKEILQVSRKRSKDLRHSSISNTNYVLNDPEITPQSNGMPPIEIDCQRTRVCNPKIAPSPNEEGRRRNTTGSKRRTILERIFMDLSMTNRLDFLAFFIFNIAFIVFNVIYFLKLLNASN